MFIYSGGQETEDRSQKTEDRKQNLPAEATSAQAGTDVRDQN